MNLNDFYDVHCHRAKSGAQSIVSRYEHFTEMDENSFLSLGAHPWYLENVDWNDLKTGLMKERVLAIGECGLDRVCETDWVLQVAAFRKQIGFAKELHKPLVIHCVRAWSELITELKGAEVPIVVHGFNKGVDLAKRLLKEGYYLSLGLAVMKPPMEAVIKSIPLNRMMFETDDSDESVALVYKRVSDVLEIDLNELVLQIKQNVFSVFEID